MTESQFEVELTLTDEEFREQMTELFKTAGNPEVSKSKFEKLTLKVTNSRNSHVVTATYLLTELSAEVVR